MQNYAKWNCYTLHLMNQGIHSNYRFKKTPKYSLNNDQNNDQMKSQMISQKWWLYYCYAWNNITKMITCSLKHSTRWVSVLCSMSRRQSAAVLSAPHMSPRRVARSKTSSKFWSAADIAASDNCIEFQRLLQEFCNCVQCWPLWARTCMIINNFRMKFCCVEL